MSGHTPGPWVIDPDDRQDVVPASNPNHVGIAIVQRMDHNGVQYVWGGQSEANARLIAAAPELLAALEDLYEAYGRSVAADDWDLEAGRSAAAAIAKAVG